jgi:DNA-binding PadR family transcriptional regulator
VADLESKVLDQMHNRVVKSFLDMVILMELRKRPMSGFDVVTHVNNKFYMSISLGSVCSYLSFLERRGLIRGEKARKSRVYELTEQGEETVKVFLSSKDKILGMVLNLFIGS